MTETELMREIMVRATQLDCRLMRNNVGMTKYRDQHGDVRATHYGLAVGSSDLIGWLKRGGVAVFLAVEVKTKTGRVTREQQTFIDAVNLSGGVAGVCRSVSDFDDLVGR